MYLMIFSPPLSFPLKNKTKKRELAQKVYFIVTLHYFPALEILNLIKQSRNFNYSELQLPKKQVILFPGIRFYKFTMTIWTRLHVALHNKQQNMIYFLQIT